LRLTGVVDGLDLGSVGARIDGPVALSEDDLDGGDTAR
jgi:hypothetical protein